MKSTLVYAHRGLSSEFLENTRSAFDRAVEAGVDGIETDVQISRDGVSVLWHDEHLAKLGHPEIRIGEVDYVRLSQIDLAGSGRIRAGDSGLLRLGDFVSDYAPQCKLILEVKNLEWDQASGRHQVNIERCLEIAKGAQAVEPFKSIVISSFDLESLLHAHSIDPDQSLVYNLDRGFSLDELKRALDEHSFFQGFCVPIDDLDSQASQLISYYQKSLIVFTCNSAAQIKKAFDLGVDVLISDFPHKAIELRD